MIQQPGHRPAASVSAAARTAAGAAIRTKYAGRACKSLNPAEQLEVLQALAIQLGVADAKGVIG